MFVPEFQIPQNKFMHSKVPVFRSFKKKTYSIILYLLIKNNNNTMSIIQLFSAIQKLLNGTSIGNIPMKMLVCLIGGYYDIEAWDYIKIVFLLSIKVINHLSFGTGV